MRRLFLAWAISFQLIAIAQTSDKRVTSFKIIPEILVKPIMGVMRISRDTIEFKIGNHLDPGTVKVEDIFSQHIGFQVTEEGRIFYNGKEIEAMLIDGDPVAAFDYRIIAKHLNAKMFSSIELIQHYQSNRFDKDFISTDAVAVNLKMKKEYSRKLNADIAAKLGTPKGWLASADISRLRSRLKSITALNRNTNAEWSLIAFSDHGNSNKRMHAVSDFIMHPLAVQGFPFKNHHLSNNTSYQLESTHSIRIGRYQQLNVALDQRSVDQYFAQMQRVEFNAFERFSRTETRSTQLHQIRSSTGVNLMYVHDRMKNNRGKYVFQWGRQQLHESLYDTVSLVSSWINRGLSGQSRNAVYFSGEEKLRLFNKNVLECRVEGSSNKFNRSIQDQLIKSNQIDFVQDFMLGEMSSSFRIRNNVFQTGIRFLTEQRGMNGVFYKKYGFVEHQSRMSRKIQLQTEAAVGTGRLMLKGNSFGDVIHQLKGQLIYTKSMFNQFYFLYMSRRTIPDIDVWAMNNIYLSQAGYQYLAPPVEFTAMRKIEAGKSYHNVYTGLQYRFSSNYQVIQNDMTHGYGFQSYVMTDTIQFNGRNQSFQVLAEGSVFLHQYKIRLSANYQLSSSGFMQSLLGNPMVIQMKNQTAKVTAKTAWQHPFQAEVSLSMNQIQSNTGYAENSFMIFQQQVQLKYKPWKGGLAGMYWQLIHPQNGQTYSFMDLFLQIQPSRSFSVKLTGLNLMDMRQYRQQHIIAYGMQQVSAMLQGRKLQLACSVNF
ncbi:hypothetical protein LBMAG23_15040 [Bacteroidota bacterium]|nr:hypothetical protein LBMAG23_15040 [Bacteroidota bacterium]